VGLVSAGFPEQLIKALHARGARDLTLISNNMGIDDFGAGILLKSAAGEKSDRHLRSARIVSLSDSSLTEKSRLNSCPKARSPSGFAPLEQE